MPKKKQTKRSFGNIRHLPSGNWQARYTGPDDVEHKALTTFISREHAEGWLTDERRLISDSRWTPPTVRLAAAVAGAGSHKLPTLEEWVETVVRRRESRLRRPLAATTADLYRKDARLRIIPDLGRLRLDQLTRARIAGWWDGLDQSTPTQNARAYSLLRSVMVDAVDDELIATNPCRLKGVGKPAPNHKAEALTAAETLAYVAAVPQHRRVPLMIAAWCGLRSGEVRGLRRRDVDLTAQTLTVSQAVSRVKVGPKRYGWRIAPPKTAAGLRTVAMPPQLVEPLRTHLAALPIRGRDALLFTAEDGISPMCGTVLGTAHAAGRRALGRPSLTIHDLRRTAATLAAQGGATTRELMRLLGHTTVNVAMLYQVPDDLRDRARADRLAEQLRGAS
jgi:integrase